MDSSLSPTSINQTYTDDRTIPTQQRKSGESKRRIHKLSEQVWFVEHLPPDDSESARSQSKTVWAWATWIPAKDCSRIVKELSRSFPMAENMRHLKRVRKSTQQSSQQKKVQQSTHTTVNDVDNQDDQPPRKRKKNQGDDLEATKPVVMLEVLIASFDLLDENKDENCSCFQDQFCKASGSDPVSFIQRQSLEKKFLQNNPNVQAILMGMAPPVFPNEFIPAPTVQQSSHEQETPSPCFLHLVRVPRYPPQSQQEATEFKAIWPTQFFPLRSKEHQEQQTALTEEEMTSLHQLILDLVPPRSPLISAVEDTDSNQNSSYRPGIQHYAVVVDPKTHTIVSKSWEEAKSQQRPQLDQFPKSGAPSHESQNKNCTANHTGTEAQVLSPSSLPLNPLATPILHALQGVARLERVAAETAANHQSFAQGQYLCTGYDLVVSYEPTIFEAMACVHSRLRRLVVVAPSFTETSSMASLPSGRGGVWHRALSRYKIHALPGTNHHFRALEYHFQPS